MDLNPDDVVQLLKLLGDAVQGGNWILAAPLLVLLFVKAARLWLIPKFAAKYPVLGDKRFTLALAVLAPIALSLAAALVTGAPVTVGMIVMALLSGLGGIGLNSGLKNWKEGAEQAAIKTDADAAKVLRGPEP